MSPSTVHFLAMTAMSYTFGDRDKKRQIARDITQSPNPAFPVLTMVFLCHLLSKENQLTLIEDLYELISDKETTEHETPSPSEVSS